MRYEPRAQTAVCTQDPSRIRVGLALVALIGALAILAWPKGSVLAGHLLVTVRVQVLDDLDVRVISRKHASGAGRSGRIREESFNSSIWC